MTVLMEYDFNAGTEAAKLAKLQDWYWVPVDGIPVNPELGDDGESNYAQMVMPTGGPWVDPNHAFPGRGYCNNLFCSGRKNEDGLAWEGLAPYRAYPAISDIRNCTLEYVMRVVNFGLPIGGHLVQHLQSSDRKQPPETTWAGQAQLLANVIQTADTISKQVCFGDLGVGRRGSVDFVRNSGWRTVRIPFIPRDADWAFLGCTTGRTSGGGGGGQINYGAMASIDDFLADWNMNMQLIAFFGTPNETDGFSAGTARVGGGGEIHIQRVRLLSEGE